MPAKKKKESIERKGGRQCEKGVDGDSRKLETGDAQMHK